MSVRNGILDYFSFGRSGNGGSGRAEAMGGSQPTQYRLLNVYVQYLAVAAGVALQPLISQMLKGATIDLTYLTSGILFGSLAIAMVIFPGAYRPSVATTPRFVQFCVLFGVGIGWQAIVQSMLQ